MRRKHHTGGQARYQLEHPMNWAAYPDMLEPPPCTKARLEVAVHVQGGNREDGGCGDYACEAVRRRAQIHMVLNGAGHSFARVIALVAWGCCMGGGWYVAARVLVLAFLFVQAATRCHFSPRAFSRPEDWQLQAWVEAMDPGRVEVEGQIG